MDKSDPLNPSLKRALSSTSLENEDSSSPKRANLELQLLDSKLLETETQPIDTAMKEKCILITTSDAWCESILQTTAQTENQCNPSTSAIVLDDVQASTSSTSTYQVKKDNIESEQEAAEVEEKIDEFLERDLSFLEKTITLFKRDESGKYRANNCLLFLLAHLEQSELNNMVASIQKDDIYDITKWSINAKAFAALRVAYVKDNSSINSILQAKKIVGLSWHIFDECQNRGLTIAKERRWIGDILAEHDVGIKDATLEKLYQDIRMAKQSIN